LYSITYQIFKLCKISTFAEYNGICRIFLTYQQLKGEKMGREIRRVPPNYEHPKRVCVHRRRCEGGKCYQPQFEHSYEEAEKEWLDGQALWLKGEYPDQEPDCDYCEWAGEAPDREYYRSYKDEEATWYQVYETVSEGTPVTPPFETQQELIDYLVNNGDFWGQQRFKEGWLASPGRSKPGYSREAAEKFVLNTGFCFSMVVENGVIKNDIESCV
jgi:hypothetical protein